VILEQRGFGIAQAGGDVLPFLLRQHDAVEALVQHVVVVERARVLRERVDLAAERAPRPPVDGVAVRGAHDVGPGGVHGGVDHVRGRVEQAVLPAVDHFSAVVDEDEVGFVDQGECSAERIDPVFSLISSECSVVSVSLA